MNLIHDGIEEEFPSEPCAVGGITIILFSIRNWIALINSSSEEFPSTQTPVVNLIHDGIAVGGCTSGVVFTRLEPISIIPEPIPAYFGL